MPLPTLPARRLDLRPFHLDDAPLVQRLAGDRAIAHTTLRIPHPYPDGAAKVWIGTHAPAFADDAQCTLAVVSHEAGQLIGAIHLGIDRTADSAELGYWIGRAWWGQGYATEAAQTLVRFGFRELRLHRIHATHLTRNPASGRVMQKLGMRHEGTCRGATKKWGIHEDLELYGLLHSEWHEPPEPDEDRHVPAG